MITKETIIKHFADNFKPFMKIATNIAGDDADDLFQECSLMILEMSEERLQAAWNETQGLKPFFVRVLINQYRSETSRYHKEFRKLSKFLETNSEDVTYNKEIDDIEEIKLDLVKIDIVRRNMSALNLLLFEDDITLQVWDAYVETGSLRKAVAYLNNPKLDLQAVHEIVRRARKTFVDCIKTKKRNVIEIGTKNKSAA